MGLEPQLLSSGLEAVGRWVGQAAAVRLFAPAPPTCSCTCPAVVCPAAPNVTLICHDVAAAAHSFGLEGPHLVLLGLIAGLLLGVLLRCGPVDRGQPVEVSEGLVERERIQLALRQRRQ